jgi:hypothetical protein
VIADAPVAEGKVELMKARRAGIAALLMLLLMFGGAILANVGTGAVTFLGITVWALALGTEFGLWIAATRSHHRGFPPEGRHPAY